MKSTIEFIGNPEVGMEIFAENCKACHGNLGETGFGNGYGESLDHIDLNRWSRKTLDNYIKSEDHDGKIIYSTLNYIDKTDLFSYVRGTGGVPGFIIKSPEGSCADVEAQTFLSLTKVKKENTSYKVMFKRILHTGNNDDIQFNLAAGSYKFSILLSNNDDLNFVGALDQELKFLESKY